jgi:hypothetical protein
MNLPALDSATTATIVSALAGMVPQELVAALDVLKKRHGLQFALTVSAMANAVGVTGQAAPTSAVEVAGLDPAGLLTALRTDTLGNIRVGGQFAPGTSSSGPPNLFPILLGAVDFSGLIQKLRSAGGADTGGAGKGGLYVVAGNSARVTYWLIVAAAAPTTNTFDFFVIEAPAGQDVYLRRVWLLNPGNATGAALRQWNLYRTTTAGAGGAATPQQLDPADGAYGGICRVGAAGLAGTLGASLTQIPIFIPAAVGPFTPTVIIDFTNPMGKAAKIAGAITNGLALRDSTGGAGSANVGLLVEFDVATSTTGAPP